MSSPDPGGFSNPIIGGDGGLVYPAIHSPNFVHGVSGWTINKDGSAEFDNLTVRGTFLGFDWILNSSGFFVYSGTPAAGNLVFSVAAAAGVDGFTNAYKAQQASYANDGFGTFIQQLLGALVLGNTTFPNQAAGAGVISLNTVGGLVITAGSTGGAVQLNQDGTVQLVKGRFLLASDPNGTGGEEQYHAIAAGQFAAGWTAGTPAPRLKLKADGLFVAINGVAMHAAFAGNANILTVPAGYVPTNANPFWPIPGIASGGAAVTCLMGASGVLSVSGAPAGTTSVAFAGDYPND